MTNNDIKKILNDLIQEVDNINDNTDKMRNQIDVLLKEIEPSESKRIINEEIIYRDFKKNMDYGGTPNLITAFLILVVFIAPTFALKMSNNSDNSVLILNVISFVLIAALIGYVKFYILSPNEELMKKSYFTLKDTLEDYSIDKSKVIEQLLSKYDYQKDIISYITKSLIVSGILGFFSLIINLVKYWGNPKADTYMYSEEFLSSVIFLAVTLLSIASLCFVFLYELKTKYLFFNAIKNLQIEIDSHDNKTIKNIIIVNEMNNDNL